MRGFKAPAIELSKKIIEILKILLPVIPCLLVLSCVPGFF